MKSTWEAGFASVQRRIRKLVKKWDHCLKSQALPALFRESVALKRTVVLLAVLPLILPVGAVSARSLPVVPSGETSGTAVVASLNENIVEVKPRSFSVELRQSPYQKARLRRTLAVAARGQVEGEPDPGFEFKRVWAQKAAAAWNIDWKILEAVWQVESGKTWWTTRRSYAGATGPCQFMPGTWRAYAQDGDGNGSQEIYSARDCLFGAAKLLSVNGAASGNIRGALLRYNHSLAYVNKVLKIAESL